MKKIIKVFMLLSIFMLVYIFPAKYAGEFLNLGFGANAAGMGNAYSTIADINSIYFNPANTYFLKENSAIFSHTSFFEGLMKYDIAAGNVSIKGNQLGIGMMLTTISDIPFTDNALVDEFPDSVIIDYDKIKYYNWHTLSFLFNYSKKIKTLPMGINFKIFYKGIDEYYALGLGLDLGMTYQNGYFTHSVVIHNITTSPLFWNTGDKELVIPDLVLGNSFNYSFSKLDWHLLVSFDIKTYFENRKSEDQFNVGGISFDTKIGTEISIKKRLFLRIGNDAGNMTFGVGLQIAKFQVDYALLSHDELENSHKISIIYKW